MLSHSSFYRLCALVVFALNLCTVREGRASADSVVVFNEIQYHPRTAAESEWIELHSLQGVNVDISGWRIEGGVDFTFPNGTVIPGHGFIVVAANPNALSGVSALGPFSGQLSNSGEEIRLLNNSGRVMDQVSYGDNGDWPVGPDGSGATLVKVDQESADAGPSHWTTSPRIGGSPGVKNFPQPTDPVVVTTAIAMNAAWKYRDDNVAPSPGWNAINFDDSAWKSGNALLYAGSPNITGAGEGLLGYWPLEETTGTTAPNLASGGAAGALFSGATWVTDATRGKVLNLDGVDGYVSAGSVPQMTLTNDFTWSFWANSAQTGTTNVVLGNRYSPTGAEFDPREFLKFTPSSLEFHRNATGEDIDYTDFPTNSWVHHAVVKQGTTLTYYRNGVAAGSRTITQGQNNPQPFYFGGDKTSENWAGKLDDIAIWTKALPASSVTGLANGSQTPLTAPTGSSGGTLGTQLTQGPTTHYFRRAFNFTGVKERTTLTLQHMLDDGAVFYLNGVEVLRVNMPSGVVSHSTAASSNLTSTALSSTITIPSDALVNGNNVLAVEVHQHTANPDMVFGASLVATEQPGAARFPGTGMVFSEISAAGSAQFQVELYNSGTTPVDLAGYRIASANGLTATLSSQIVAPGGYVVITTAQLGFTPLAGEQLFLLQPGGSEFEDAQTVTNKLRARALEKGGRWLFPSTASFGAANSFGFNTDVVINELMYNPHPSQAAQEQWIELYNRGSGNVNLGGWKLSDGIDYIFPANTTLAPGQYLVIAGDTAAFAQHHSGVTALGPFTGSLKGSGERVVLEDTAGNPVDEVRYFDGGRWDDLADGGGSSLERKDPRADSSSPENWAGSDESSRGQWQTITYNASGANISNDPTQWNEFIFGLLSKGSFLIDDISVKQDPGTLNTQLIQNQDFSTGATTAWRLLGTHKRGTVVADPDDAGNKVLRVDTSGATGHMHNHVETTLKNGAAYVTISTAKTYEISFRARWLGGSNLLNSRLYFNRGARTTALAVSPSGGTPGAVNSRAVTNLGPTYRELIHSPAVPPAGQSATVSVRPADPNGIDTLSLFYSVNAGAFASVPMTDPDNDGVFKGTIPAQSTNTKVQFYVQATDKLGAPSFFPAKGPNSRAIIPWADGQAGNGPAANFRITMLTADANLLHDVTQVMSDDEIGATVIYRESEIYYDIGVRLKGSERGRSNTVRVGWHLRFPPHDPFLGAHQTIAVDRSGSGDQFSQKEILVIHALNRAGNIPGSYDDLIRVIAPRSNNTSSAMLQKARYSDEFLDNQFENGADGPMFEFELIYFPTTTNNGSVEGLKLPQPDDVRGVGFTSLGTNKELYRWHYLQKNNRQVDDYTGIMAATTAMGTAQGAQFYANTRAQLDVDEWLRSFAIQQLFGIGDSYATGGQHNATFYTRPSDRKTLYFPKDMDFTFSNDASASIAAGDLSKLIGDPANKRAYYGHLLDIISRSFNSAYMTPWAQHYMTFLGGENLTTWMSYINTRVNSVRSQINAAIPPTTAFAITSNGGQPITVNGASVTLQGTGWVNIREIRLVGSTLPIPVTWNTDRTWQVVLPVNPGTQTITLQAIGFDGAVLGTTTITVTNTSASPWGPLRINEWMASNQTILDAADNDADDWIEIYNPTAAAVNLENWQISDGTAIYTIPAGYSVPAGGFLLIWADDEVLQNTGSGQLHVPFKLSASGESIILRAPDNTTVDIVTFGTQADGISEGRYPDGAAGQQQLTYASPLKPNVLTVANVSRAGSAITLTFSTTPGTRYQVEVSDDLTTWQNLGAVQTAAGNSLTVQDDAGAAPKRFYRVRVEP